MKPQLFFWFILIKFVLIAKALLGLCFEKYNELPLTVLGEVRDLMLISSQVLNMYTYEDTAFLSRCCATKSVGCCSYSVGAFLEQTLFLVYVSVIVINSHTNNNDPPHLWWDTLSRHTLQKRKERIDTKSLCPVVSFPEFLLRTSRETEK